MKLNKLTNNAEIELSYNDLIVLNAALNEICHGIDSFEFETRIGASRSKVELLMKEIQAILDQIEKR